MITSKLSCTFTLLYPLSPPWASTWIVLCPVAHVLMTNISYCISHAAIDGGISFCFVLYFPLFPAQFPALCRLVLLRAAQPSKNMTAWLLFGRVAGPEEWHNKTRSTVLETTSWLAWTSVRSDAPQLLSCVWAAVLCVGSPLDLVNLRSYNLVGPGPWHLWSACDPSKVGTSACENITRDQTVTVTGLLPEEKQGLCMCVYTVYIYIFILDFLFDFKETSK